MNSRLEASGGRLRGKEGYYINWKVRSMLLENMSGASIGHIEKQEERGVRNNGEMSGAAARTGDLIRKREGNYIKIK